MNAKSLGKFRIGALIAVPLLLALLMPVRSSVAATEQQIEDSITNGISWLASRQQIDGSWLGHTAITCMALVKLQDRAYELGTTPFDPGYEYSSHIIDGWGYVLTGGRAAMQAPLPVQFAGDPDTNGNGYGLYFQYDVRHRVYTTGLCILAMVATGDPALPNHGGLDLDGVPGPDTYGTLVQEAVDWLSFAQSDATLGRGGWGYDPYDNSGSWSDNSISGYAVLGLAAGQNFGATVPQWVKDELNNFIDYIQNDTTGASGYESPTSWNNLLKTGNLLFEMTFVGDANTSPRFLAALGYIEDMWQNPTPDPGWGYSLPTAHYQAMYTLMKGLEYSNVDLIDTDGDANRDDDWFNQEPTLAPSQDFASVLVGQQNLDGSWPTDYWGGSELATIWALLTLEKSSPVSDLFEVAVDKDYRYTAVCFEKDNDLDGSYGEDPVEYLDGVPLLIDNDADGLIDEDGQDCEATDTGYELPVTGVDPEAYTLEAVLKKNGKVSSYNPGQYYAVSSVHVTRLVDAYDTILLTIEEDFAECTVSDYPISELNPKKGGGSVVVVEVIDGMAYQVYDAESAAITIHYDGDLEASAVAEFEYTFAPDQEEATLLVYVKFAPGLKGMMFDEASHVCLNINAARLDVFDESLIDPIFSTGDEADAWLKVVEK